MMKKILSIIIVSIFMIGATPVLADEIYYPCYEGEWVNYESEYAEVELDILWVDGNKMSYTFRYGQFEVSVYDALISGNTVSGSYYEVWNDGVNWDNYVINGTINLNLGDETIWLDWHSYENGQDCSTKGFMMYPVFAFDYQMVKDSDVKIIVNGETLSFDVNPVSVNDRILVPMRAIAESIGAEVSWEDVRKVGRVAGFNKNDKSVSFYVDYTEYANPFEMNMYVEGDFESKTIELDAPAIIYHDRTMVPVRALSEALDAEVIWDDTTRTIDITTNK